MASKRSTERKSRPEAPRRRKTPGGGEEMPAPAMDSAPPVDDHLRRPTTLPLIPEDVIRLVRVARENPYRFFTLGDVAKICGFGTDVMTALNALGAPVVGRKCNPQLLLEWIGRNSDKIGKIRGD